MNTNMNNLSVAKYRGYGRTQTQWACSLLGEITVQKRRFNSNIPNLLDILTKIV